MPFQEKRVVKIETFVLAFFFLSGMCGLIYEVLWIRLLKLVMGNTVFSAATVLTAFMGGLALGSYIAGSFIDKHGSPLKIYGILEGLIGIYCLLIPYIIQSTEPFYRIIYQNFRTSFLMFSLFRFLVSGAILLIPTTLMGATLPILIKHFAGRLENLGWTVGKLYSINTFGAVLGSFGTGFFLIPNLGINWSLRSAAAVNIAISIVILIFFAERTRIAQETTDLRDTGQPQEEQTEQPQPERSKVPPWLVLIGLGMAGFASMLYEVAWTRVLSLTIGSSVYAFSLMLTAFIAGIGLGSALFSRMIDRRKNLAVFFGIAEVIIGLSALIVVPIFGKLPVYIVEIIARYSRFFGKLHLVEFGLIFLLMLIPTILMGAIFPLASKIYTQSIRRIGSSIGRVYSSNTLGAVLGSFTAGFILIPSIGIQRTIMAGVLINVLIGLVFLWLSYWLSKTLRFIVLAAILIVSIAASYMVPPWDRTILSSGPYLYAYKYKQKSGRERASIEEVMKGRHSKILYYKEGVSTTVTVVESGSELFMKVNGKTDATSRGDRRTQSLLGHLPLLVHRQPKDVLLIGLGSGISLGSIEQYPIKSVDCVEISPEVAEGAKFFSKVNNNALADSRANIIIEDGRNHITLTNRTYDVIISQPSNLWISGMADLFTKEFFELCDKRLKSDGIICSWIQAYLMSKTDFRTLIRTFSSVFPNATLWESVPGQDYFLVASKGTADIDYKILSRNFGLEKVKLDLKRIKILDEPSLLSCFVTAQIGTSKLGQNMPIHTDDNLLLEFSAPKSMYKSLYGGPEAFQIEDIASVRTNPVLVLTDLGENPVEIKNMINRAYEARKYSLLGFQLNLNGQFAPATATLEKAASINPTDVEAVSLLPQLYFSRGYFFMQTQHINEAIGEYKRGLSLEPDNANAHRNLGLLYEMIGMFKEAGEEYKTATQLYPEFTYAYNNLGNIYFRSGAYNDALAAYKKAAEIDPKFVITHVNIGRTYATIGNLAAAKAEWETALKIDPTNVAATRYLERLRQTGEETR